MAHVGNYDAVEHSVEAAENVRSSRLQVVVRRSAYALLGLSFMLLTWLEQWRLLKRLLVRHMNSDHALLWLAAREWSQLSVREPTFYGQTYGVTFEAIPTAILHAFGVPYTYALPLALFLLAWSAWLCLAAAAYRRDMPLAALAALAAPCLLNLKHWIIVGVIATGVGRLLAAVCAGLVLRGVGQPSRAFTAVLIGGLAVAFDTASLILVGPALLWSAWTWLPLRRFWKRAALGLIAPAAWVALNIVFTYLHPDHDMHATWSYVPEMSPLHANLSQPDPLFSAQGLEVWHSGRFVPLLLVALLALALGARAWREAAAISCAIAQLTYLASLTKSFDDIGTLWYPAARMTLGVPMTLWFLTSVTLRACWLRVRRRVGGWTPLLSLLPQLSVPLLVVLVCSSAGARALHFEQRVSAIERRGVEPIFLELSHPWDIEATCDQAQRAAHEWGTNIVAFPTQGTEDYACPALYPELLTVFPSYERRYWVLHELASTPQRRMIVWGRDERFCRTGRARSLFTECHAVASGHAIAVSWQNKDPLQIMRGLRHKVRPFGDGCHPKDTSTCSWWVQRYYSQ